MITSLCALIAVSAQAQTVPSLDKVHRVVTMGDSITQMGGSPDGYVTLLGNALKSVNPAIEVINVGIGGQKAPDMWKRFGTDVIERKPDIVTISVGINDVWHDFRNPQWSARVPEGNSGRGVKLPDYIKGVDSMVMAAQSAGATVILLSPTVIYEDLTCAENQRLLKYVKAEEAIAKKRGVKFINLNKIFRDAIKAYRKTGSTSQLLLTTDGVHLNQAGNALVADTLLGALGVKAPDRISPR